MRPETVAALVEGAIPFFGGIYAALLGFRVVGKRPGQDARYDEWHAKYGQMFKICGPVMVLFGVFFVLKGLASAP